MRWFTSDWHLGETRLGDINKGEFNPFFRPFSSTEENNKTIIDNMNKYIQPDDELFHIGDVCMTIKDLPLLNQIKCKNRVLIVGNYDVDDKKKLQELKKYFSKVILSKTMFLDEEGPKEIKVHLNHYPSKARKDMFNIVGHIHGLWKVQKNMINVSVDAWHFKPVSETEILVTINAINNFYDENVFPK